MRGGAVNPSMHPHPPTTTTFVPAAAAVHTGATSEVGPAKARRSVLVQRKTRPASPAPHARSRPGSVTDVGCVYVCIWVGLGDWVGGGKG